MTPETAISRIPWDSHMHTPLCHHAIGDPSDYARQALEQGLRGITFTCHSPMPRGFMSSVRMSFDEWNIYQEMVAETTSLYLGQLEVLLGLESDYFPGMNSWLEELHQSAPLHYVLGSVHWHGQEYMNQFGRNGYEHLVHSYFDHLAESAESGLFDCLAHPDLVKNYRPELWDFDQFSPVIEDSLSRIADTGVAMELNTSGLLKSLREINPGPRQLGLMAEKGIPLVIGSDSHHPGRVGENFDLGASMAWDAGYRKVRVFRNRIPRDYCLISGTFIETELESVNTRR
jgi:histidinol-phosphatase (PHP family)